MSLGTWGMAFARLGAKILWTRLDALAAISGDGSVVYHI